MAKRKSKRVKREPLNDTVGSAVSTAFAGAEELRDELQNWYDNLPESFQNGTKGEELQEAISALEGGIEPSAPACVADMMTSISNKRRKSRADRLAECAEWIESAKGAAECTKDDYENLEYDDEEDADGSGTPRPEDPQTEEDRDSRVGELDTFISECEDLLSEWENVSFPGMY